MSGSDVEPNVDASPYLAALSCFGFSSPMAKNIKVITERDGEVWFGYKWGVAAYVPAAGRRLGVGYFPDEMPTPEAVLRDFESLPRHGARPAR